MDKNNDKIKKSMEMIDFVNNGDPENWHYDADRLLCKVLRDCGYDELVEWFENHTRWYA